MKKLERKAIDWSRTAETIKAALSKRSVGVPWLSEQVSAKLGCSEASKSELYALVSGRPFRLSDDKLEAVFEILTIKPTLRSDSVEGGPLKPMMAYCTNPVCRESRLVLNGIADWAIQPLRQKCDFEMEKFCKFCGGALILACPCGHPLSGETHCQKCGLPYVPVPQDLLDVILDHSSKDQRRANTDLVRRMTGAMSLDQVEAQA